MHTHDFAYRMVIIKTSRGYVTRSGFTDNVNSKDIVAIRASSLGGKWTSIATRLRRFREYLDRTHSVSQDDCEFYTYDVKDTERKELCRWHSM